MTDPDLLAAYIDHRSEEAFKALVERYLPIVLAAALRQRAAPDAAEDIAQAVFIVLARRASHIRDPRLLPAWLLQVTSYCVTDAQRSARRRRLHEAEAATMQQHSRTSDQEPESLADITPHLDAALAELPPLDRTLIVLRYFQQQNSPQISQSLGLSEEAARKRLSRALEKVRKFFLRRGVTLSAALVATAVTRVAAAAPPVGTTLLQKTCTAALSNSAASTSAGLIAKGALHMITWATAKTAGIAAALVLFTAGTITAAIHLAGPHPATPPHGLTPVAAAAQHPFTLKVVDTQNRPLSHAQIGLDGTSPFSGVATDADGLATISPPDPVTHQFVIYSQRSRRYALFSVLPGQSPATLVATADCFGATIDGTVTDSSGNPVKGAGVRLFVATPAGDIFHFTAGTSDASGYFNGAIPARQGLTCWATTSDDPNDPSATLHIPLTEQYQFELPNLVIRTATAPAPGSAAKRIQYAGRVLDGQGHPIPNVEVSMSYPKNHMSYEAGTPMTDAEGYFHRLLPPDADRISFRLTARDFIGFQFERTDLSPSTDALKAGTAVLTMKRGLPLAGTITDAASHKPILNALVLTGQFYSSALGEVIEDFTSPRTDVSGRFCATGLPPGKHSVHIIADGCSPELTTVDLGADSSPLNVQLQPGLTYSGTVLDIFGNPIPDTRVNAEDWQVDGQRVPIYRQTRTDAQGHFTLTDLPQRGEVRTLFSAKNLVIVSGMWKPNAANATSISLYPKPVVSGTVLDDTTGQPIQKFQALPAWYISGKPSVLDFNKSQKAHNSQGHFSLTVGNFIDSVDDRTQVAARIVADGYLPQYTPPIIQDGEPHPVTIRLHPAQSIRATVLDLDGQPLPGAKAYAVGPHDAAYVEGTALNDQLTYAPRDSSTTKDDGLIKLPPVESPGRLLVLHPSGYALADTDSVLSASTITLTPWAIIEGTLAADGKPLNGVPILLCPIRSDPLQIPKPVQFSLSATTDAHGHFRFAHVPNIPLLLGRSQYFGISNAQLVHPEPGKSITINLDQPGTLDIAKLDFSALPQPVDLQWIQARAFRIDPPLSVPPGLDEAYNWSAAIASLPDHEPDSEASALIFQNLANPSTDGALRFNNLSPGRYVAYIDVHAPQAPNTCGWGRILAHGKLNFQISADRPHLTLPAPTLERNLYPQVGDTAPNIQATTLDGHPFSLDSLRGKYVLLHFWASWCQPCRDEIPTLKDLAAQYANKPLVFIGGNFDWDTEARDAAFKEFKLPWTQLPLGELSFDQPVAKAYGFSAIPFTCLISPDGKILAQDVPPTQLQSTLHKFLPQ